MEPRGLGLRHRRPLTISRIELRQIAGDALIDLLQTPLHLGLNARQTLRIASPLSLRKSAMVLKSGIRWPVNQTSSTLRWHSRSSRRLDWTRLKYLDAARSCGLALYASKFESELRRSQDSSSGLGKAHSAVRGSIRATAVGYGQPWQRKLFLWELATLCTGPRKTELRRLFKEMNFLSAHRSSNPIWPAT
jgi:hypothetical protein